MCHGRYDGWVSALFEVQYERLLRSLAVAFDAESAADAIQEAFIQADRGWSRVATLDDSVGCVRRMAVNRLLNKRQNSRRRARFLERFGRLQIET